MPSVGVASMRHVMAAMRVLGRIVHVLHVPTVRHVVHRMHRRAVVVVVGHQTVMMVNGVPAEIGRAHV